MLSESEGAQRLRATSKHPEDVSSATRRQGVLFEDAQSYDGSPGETVTSTSSGFTSWGNRTGVLHVGMTGFFTHRVGQHKSGLTDGFTKNPPLTRIHPSAEHLPDHWYTKPSL